MSPLVLIATFVVFMAVSTYWLARRDVLFAGFYAFFFVYCVFAMIGYALFPILSVVQNLYFGPGVFVPFFAFVGLSFASYLIAFAALRRRLIRPRFDVAYVPVAWRKLTFYFAVSAFTSWQLAVFIRDYDRIGYNLNPQIPDFAFVFGFKSAILLLLPLYAVVRRHALTGFERLLGALVLAAGLAVFFAIAGRSGNRTDVLALLLGIAVYEAYPTMVTATGGLSLRVTARQLRSLLVALVLVTGGFLVLERVREERVTEGIGGLPTYARVLANDYYSPAHMLFASIGMDYRRPGLVIKSNLANSFMMGGMLKVPYLQTDLGNLLVPGSSSRSRGMGYFIFTEGYMLLGRLGFLYNGVFVALLIFGWRYFTSATDTRYNAYATALCAMFFAVVARSGTHLLVRNLVFSVIPAIAVFGLATGAKRMRVGHAVATAGGVR